MSAFPSVDPIPLPAPVELFKILHDATLSLHFIAVQILIGGLLVATILGFLSRKSSNGTSLKKEAAKMLAVKLPVVMTYVINLGVPPLLFLQVLYGRSFYTSSVLIGVFWIAIIFILIGAYWHIYRYSGGFELEKALWWKGLVAWILVIATAMIYSTTMTLMLRPEVWQKMYATSPYGMHLPPLDPTLMPRWLFMLTGGLVAGGLWMIWIGSSKNVFKEVGGYISKIGGYMTIAGVIINVPIAIWVMQSQPDTVSKDLSANILCKVAVILWIVSMCGILIFGIWRGFGKGEIIPSRYVGFGLIVVEILSVVVIRDTIRDATLIEKGFNVMQRVVVTNWYVVGIFLISFVLGLIAVGWLIYTMAKSKPAAQK